MNQIIDFLQTDHVLALIIACLIFLATIFLVVKRWVGFSIAVLLLIFSLVAGLVINNQHAVQQYFNAYAASSKGEEGSQDAFRKQMLQAVEDLKLEMSAEKENLKRVMDQVHEIVDSIDVQKNKLQHFIEETRERFKAEYGPKSASPQEEPKY